MKKLLDTRDNLVLDSISGLTLSHSFLEIDPFMRVVGRKGFRNGMDNNAHEKVSIITGGGSGHEPAHVGFVGEGMLTAAVCGEIFTSPSVDAVYSAVTRYTGPKGSLLIVKNYTGDRLNFGLAAELARADGLQLEIVTVADDCSLPKEGDVRRGVAGTLFVHKVAGAVAQMGGSLQEVASAARLAADRVRSMGLAISPCTNFTTGAPAFELGALEIEVGIGIHGEKGVSKEAMQSCSELVHKLLDHILTDLYGAQQAPYDRDACLMVNNLGSVTPLELSLAAGKALTYLKEKGVRVARVFVGSFMTALDMNGISLTLLDLPNLASPDSQGSQLLSYIDHDTHTIAWPKHSAIPSFENEAPSLEKKFEMPTCESDKMSDIPKGQQEPIGWDLVVKVVENVSKVLEEKCDELTRLDSVVGDGDLGTNLLHAIHNITKSLTPPSSTIHHAPSPPNHILSLAHFALKQIVSVLRVGTGGSSGPIIASFLLRAQVSIGQALSSGAIENIAQVVLIAFKQGCSAITELGGAQPGDRTLLDALHSATLRLENEISQGSGKVFSLNEIFEILGQGADQGAQATKDMLPKKGRARYLGERAKGHEDPGARAMAYIIQAVRDVL